MSNYDDTETSSLILLMQIQLSKHNIFLYAPVIYYNANYKDVGIGNHFLYSRRCGSNVTDCCHENALIQSRLERISFN